MEQSSGITEALKKVLRGVGLPEHAAGQVTFKGCDPVFRTQYKVATAGSAALGAIALAMADIREAQTGERPHIAIDVTGATASLRTGRYVRADGAAKGFGKRSPVSGFFQTANGRWNYFHCSAPPHQAALLKVLGLATPDRARVAEIVAKWDAFELESAVDEAGGLAGAVRTPGEWRALPNTAVLAAEPLVDIQKIGDSAPVPLPAGNPRPLSGLRVLDLTRVLAGPTCTRLLAESGADVLKVTCEQYPDYEDTEWDTGYAKRKAVLNFNTDAQREQAMELVKTCDVLTQSYRPGSMDRRGFGPEQAALLRPGIVYASLSAFGHSGDWKMRRGFDTVVQATSGMAHTQGRGKDPKLLPVSALDYTTGYLMAFGVLVALKRRHDEGGSYLVRVSLARCQEWLASLGLHDAATADTGVDAEELAEISKWLIEVQTPMGKLRRLRPIIRYSEELMNQLPPWTDAGMPGAVWT